MTPRSSYSANAAPNAPIDDLVTVLELVFEEPRSGAGWRYLPDEPQLTAAVVEIAEVLQIPPTDSTPRVQSTIEPTGGFTDRR